ncbi:16S rRNA pseudouridine(516) synthase RsuA [uncultured Tolumonas sp.]|uniref:16S rRNA pseudouridine(516) synthase RsuA n=1 Tax=uncultured Tolumonas sp. TaxID=263765 RepID=UPI00292E5D7F|nr:16S rRNA pseudouridine(516) synthase RsuA [uncultured Tolumonas sp.]
MRLDKHLHQCLGISRSQASLLLRAGRITVNGTIVKSGSLHVNEQDVILFDDDSLQTLGDNLYYFMLHKPQGYVCANADANHPSITQLFDLPRADELHAAGRLDVDTTGLVLVTNDGQWSHRVTSPRKQCEKIYRVWLAEAISDETRKQFAEGILLRSETQPTRPAKLEIVTPREVLLTIHEGKYHQVKRMFAAVGNHVERLHREQIGALALDANLPEGDFRALTAEEISLF